MSATTPAARLAMLLRSSGTPGGIAVLALDGKARHAPPTNGRQDAARLFSRVWH